MRPRFIRAALCCGVLLGVAGGCASRSANTPRPAPRDKSTVTSEQIEKVGASDEPIEKILQGRVAGVTVSRTPDGGIAVRVRGGSTSVYGNNEPLYIIDGMPIQPGPNGSLTGINPYDIESIKVLKDAAETAMYGMRGANGVILITMKKPGKSPRSQ